MLRLFWWMKPRSKPKGREYKGLEISILLKLEQIMADTTALTAAVAALQVSVAANTAAVADVTAVVQAGGASDQAAVDAATGIVTAANTQVATNTAAMEALKPAAPVTPPAA